MIRHRLLKTAPISSGPVVYWMSRDQRVRDNWALYEAQKQALARGQSLHVLFVLPTKNLTHPYGRHYSFMLGGLRRVARELSTLNISFHIETGEPVRAAVGYMKEVRAGLVIADFSPLRNPMRWHTLAAKQASCGFWEVDAHNVVPVWETSDKQEYSARTIRPKIYRLYDKYAIPVPPLIYHPHGKATENALPYEKQLRLSTSEKSVDTPGTDAGWRQYDRFKKQGHKGYSELSAYLHFGHLFSGSIAIHVKREMKVSLSHPFLEQLIIRKELADNYCYFNGAYDLFEGIPQWAQKTLEKHNGDLREHTYSLSQFENASTHDSLWNAAQIEMRETGRMHGYLRMYWAKKILEWSVNPRDALSVAIYLNDRYELDGRDPNGYAGILWSIGGLHDRPWFERPIFGMVRFMSRSGVEKKLDTKAYMKRWTE